MPAILAAALVVFLEVLSFGAIFPVLPDYTQSVGGSAVWVGVLFAMVAGPRVVMNVLWGRLSDRWGRRPVLFLMTVGTLAGSVLWALTPALGAIAFGGLFWLAASRLVAGCFQAQAALTQAVAADVSTPEKRAASMGMLGAAFGFGILGGIALGGTVGQHVSFAAVGWCSAAAQLASLAIIGLALRETHPRHRADAPDTTDRFQPAKILHLAQRTDIAQLLLVVLTLTVGQMILIPTLRLISDEWYGFDLMQSTWAFVLWALIGVLVQGGAIRPTVKRLGERHTAVLGAILLAAGFFLMAAHLPLWAFWTAAVLIAVGGSLVVPATTGLLSRHVGEADQGGIQGLNQSATALGRAVSYTMAGGLYALSPAIPYLAGGILCIAGSILLLALKARAPEPEPQHDLSVQ